jgi:L-fuculose-phosphate aldolase
MNESDIRDELVRISKHLHNQGYLFAADGNLSYRITDKRILITASKCNKSFITVDDFAVVDIDNKIIEGSPSSELRLHTKVYKKCKEAKCVIHAHPPVAVAWTIAKPDMAELPAEAISEIIMGVGKIPIVPYARPCTEALSNSILPYVPDNKVMILARHGVLSWGQDIMEAANGIERVENCAFILAQAHMLGGLTNLPDEEIKALHEIRQKRGIGNL